MPAFPASFAVCIADRLFTVAQLSTEKLQAMLANNKDEMIRVLQTLMNEDVDREMVAMQSQVTTHVSNCAKQQAHAFRCLTYYHSAMLEKRCKELTEAINNRGQTSSMASSVISSPSLASKQLKSDRASAPGDITQWAAGVQPTDTASEVEETSSPSERVAAGRSGNAGEGSTSRRLPIMTPSRMPSNEELQASRRAGPSHNGHSETQKIIAQSTPQRPTSRQTYPAEAIEVDDDLEDDFDMDAMLMVEAAQAEEAQIAADEAAARRLQEEWSIQPAPPPGPSRPNAAVSRTMSTGRSRSRTPVPAHAEIIDVEDEPITARIQPRPRVPSPSRVVINHPWTKEVNQKLEKMFKLPGFRHNQREAIDATLSGKDGEYPNPVQACGRRANRRADFAFSLCANAHGWRKESVL